MKKFLAFLGVIGVLASIFLVGLYFWKERTSPEKMQTTMKSVNEKAFVMRVAKQLAQMEKRQQQTRVEALSCRQLPAQINRVTLSVWGMNSDGQTVQLNSPMVEMLPYEIQADHLDMAIRIIDAMKANVKASQPLPEGSLKTKIENAKRRILSIREVPCAYEWTVVQGIVALQGEHLILDDLGEMNVLAQYDSRILPTSPYQDLRRISSHAADTENDVELSVRMIEVATALVFERSFAIRAGYAPDVLDAFRTLCPPFSISYAGFEEAAILWNAGRFLESIQYELGNQNSRELKIVRDIDRGDMRGFIARVVDRVRELEPQLIKAEQLLPPHYSCQYPPKLGGPDQGLQLLPTEINDPVINFVMIATSEQSKIAYGIQ